MIVRILSDLHFEFHKDGGKSFVESLNSDCDVVVVAGDLSNKDGLFNSLKLLCDRFKKVVYTAGNHEYYGSGFDDVNSVIRESVNSNANLLYLNRSSETIDSARFLGSTLWFKKSNAPKYQMNDFFQIRGFESWVYNENEKDVEFFKREIKPGDIVVSHYLPTNRSVSPKYMNSPLNSFFVCDISGVIQNTKPGLWIHGHTHESCDYSFGATRIVCNPFGYCRHEENIKFSDRFECKV